MTTILIFIAVLGFLVIMHELGHFVTAKLSRVKVLEFGIGFPPKVFGFTRGETAYTINALPLGGFVRMLGEEDPTDPQSFARQRPLTRLVILAAGAGVNAILPIFLLTTVFMLPQQVPVTDVTIIDVAAGSPAAEAGIQPGDVVVEAGGRQLDNSSDLVSGIQRRIGAEMTWTLERDGELTEVRLTPRVSPPEGEGATGISVTDARVTVASVAPGSVAANIGLQPGDVFLLLGNSRVLEADGAEQAAADAIEQDASSPVRVLVMRGEEIVELTLQPAMGPLTGYTADVRPGESRSLPLWEAVPASFVQMWDILVTFRNEIGRMITGATDFEVAGPVGIAQVTGEIAGAGLSPLILWTALLSINLAIINLLPIPALDGGRIIFVLVELVRGRRLAPEKERVVHMVGFALLMALIVIVSINDIQRLLSGGSITGG